MKNHYCTSCGRHLFKFDLGNGDVSLFIKCPSCKLLNSVTISSHLVTSTTFCIEVAEATKIVSEYLQKI